MLDTTTIQTVEQLDALELSNFVVPNQNDSRWIKTQSPIAAKELDRICLLSHSSTRYYMEWDMGELFFAERAALTPKQLARIA